MKDFTYDKSIAYLRKNISSIRTVSDWASSMGYSRSHFTVLISRESNELPYDLIKWEKCRKIVRIIIDNPDLKGYAIACNSGFRDDKAMCKFLNLHFDTTLSNLRKLITV